MLKLFSRERAPKHFEVGGATFTYMAITPERNERFSPNLEHLSRGSISAHSEKNHDDWPLGDAIT